MTNQEFLDLAAQYPALTSNGYGVSVDPERPCGDFKKQILLERARQELFDSHQEFDLCCQWIQANNDLLGKKHTYNLKHSVENWLRPNHIMPDYISQGVFILSAIHMGYRIHRVRGDIGAKIGKKVTP